MGASTKIQWADATWNPFNGCSRKSAGCKNCYAEKFAARFSKPGLRYEGLINERKQWTGVIRLAEDKLFDPLTWRKPKRIFVNSMSDLFHADVPELWIDRVFAVMALAPHHTFLVLTKRPERMLQYMNAKNVRNRIWNTAWNISDWSKTEPGSPADAAIARAIIAHSSPKHEEPWPLPNCHLGVSVEDQESADERIPLLLDTPAAIRWVSYEPALGPVNFWTSYTETGPAGTPRSFWQSAGWIEKLDWIVCGGESGPGARRFDPAWARAVVKQCKAAGVACFVKQMGSQCLPDLLEWRDHCWASFAGGRKGDDPAQWPEELRVQEFPK